MEHPRLPNALLLRRLARGDFVRHGFLVFASSMLVNILNYIFHVTISRRLGVAEYGDLYALFALLALTSVPVASLTILVARYAAEFRALDDAGRLLQLSNLVWKRTVLAAVGILFFGSLLSRPIGVYLAIGDSRAVMAAALVLSISIMLPAMRAFLQGVQDFRRYAISTAIEAVSKTILGIGLVVAGFGVFGALVGFAFAIAASIAYSACAVRRKFSAVKAEPLNIDLRSLLTTTGGVTAAMLALTTLGSFDVILVKHFVPPQTAGLYCAVSLVGKVLFFFVGFVPTVLLPKVTAKATTGGDPTPLVVQATIVTSIICVTGLSLLATFPGPIVTAMAGSAFQGATPYVLEYGIATTLLGITSVVVAYKVGMHRFDFVPSLIAVTTIEITTIAFYHPNVYAIIHVLIAGHAVALLCTTYRLTAVTPARRAEFVVPS